jgi:hypothetical protein
MKDCDNFGVWGKIYVLTNKDFPEQVYVGSTTQRWVSKRFYRHKMNHLEGVKSYGNLFDTPNCEYECIEMEYGLMGIPLRQKEREYLDLFKSQGLTTTNQQLPWRTDEEEAERHRNYMRYYMREWRKKDKNEKKG